MSEDYMTVFATVFGGAILAVAAAVVGLLGLILCVRRKGRRRAALQEEERWR